MDVLRAVEVVVVVVVVAAVAAVVVVVSENKGRINPEESKLPTYPIRYNFP